MDISYRSAGTNEDATISHLNTMGELGFLACQKIYNIFVTFFFLLRRQIKGSSRSGKEEQRIASTPHLSKETPTKRYFLLQRIALLEAGVFFGYSTKHSISSVLVVRLSKVFISSLITSTSHTFRPVDGFVKAGSEDCQPRRQHRWCSPLCSLPLCSLLRKCSPLAIPQPARLQLTERAAEIRPAEEPPLQQSVKSRAETVLF